MFNFRKYLCIVLMFSTVYAQDKSKEEEEPVSEQEAFMQEMQANSVVEEDPYSGLSPQRKFEQNPKHNVHEYDYKQQVIVGGAVMFCVALSLIVNNNYNPKRGK